MPQTPIDTAPDTAPDTPDDRNALRLWVRLLACHSLLESTLRSRMRDAYGTTLARFDLMSQLDRHPDGLRMREVSRLLMVTGGNVTGLTDRLVAEGLIERRDDPADRRAWVLCLTEAGRAQFGAMAQEHARWVGELLKDFDPARQQQLVALLGQLKQHLAPPQA